MGRGLRTFLLGLPQQAAVQAGLNKTYLRENIYDWYGQDDYRVTGSVTLNYGLRWEYFAPFTEKYNRLSNLDHNADFTQVAAVLPGQTGPYSGAFPRSLVNRDLTMYSPRFGFAYRPPQKYAVFKQMVVRGGYGLNFNTGQFGTVCAVAGVSAAVCGDADEYRGAAGVYGDEPDAGEWVWVLDGGDAE